MNDNVRATSGCPLVVKIRLIGDHKKGEYCSSDRKVSKAVTFSLGISTMLSSSRPDVNNS